MSTAAKYGKIFTVVCGSFRTASRLMVEDWGWKLQKRVFCILADKS